MMFSLLSIFIVIAWIILGTSFTKLHPFIVLLIAAVVLSIILGIDPIEATGKDLRTAMTAMKVIKSDA